MTAAARRLLSARDVAVVRSGVEVLRGVDLELRAGEVVVLIGPNGAGKSTLLNALAGLLPLARGTVDASGRVAAALQASALAHRSAIANIEAALSWWGVPRGERRGPALAALEALGARPLAGRLARTLSGGEIRRVHLARALALEPDVLLLDEPFAGLDAPTRAELLYDAASALRDDRRATLVIVHDRAEAWALADRVLVLLDGQVVADGTPHDVFTQPPTAAVASFVGFSGRIEQGGRIHLLRPQDVALDPNGPIDATVVGLVPIEDGVRVELAVPGGRLVAMSPAPGPAPGSAVRVRRLGGVSFPAAGVGRGSA